MWSFYAPAIIQTIRSLPPNMTAQSSLVAFTPVLGLVLSGAYAIADIATRPRAA
jgi:hypothetical protein